MTGLPPPTKCDIYDQVEAVYRVVHEAAVAMDRKWGIGRLRALVPIELAKRFAVQRAKWAAVELDDLDGVTRHGNAMLRAYDKLDATAIEAGHKPLPPDQWEFMANGKLIILVRYICDAERVETGGRACSVWSTDEISGVIREHPAIAAVKEEIPGAVVEPLKPTWNKLDDPLTGLPFWEDDA